MVDIMPGSSNPPLQSALRQLQAANTQEKPRLFLEYCLVVIKAKNDGDLSIEDAGYQIAETMFIRELNEPLFDEITSLAGSLEIPYHLSGVQPVEGWDRLVQLIHRYDLRLHKKAT